MLSKGAGYIVHEKEKQSCSAMHLMLNGNGQSS